MQYPATQLSASSTEMFLTRFPKTTTSSASQSVVSEGILNDEFAPVIEEGNLPHCT